MKPKILEVKEFACVAEAIAHYYAQGFCTFETLDDCRFRWMRNEGTQKVCIEHRGLLDVIATKFLVEVS